MREMLQPQWLHVKLIREGIARALGEIERGRLLDVGCGVRPYEPLVTSLGHSYVGLDRPSKTSQKPRCDVIGSSLALPFREGAFDAVLSTQVLEHVPEPGDMIKEAARVL